MMTEQNLRLYDENSVFNKLFKDDKPPSPPTKAERMAAIFEDAMTTETNIQVSDFLPIY